MISLVLVPINLVFEHVYERNGVCEESMFMRGMAFVKRYFYQQQIKTY